MSGVALGLEASVGFHGGMKLSSVLDLKGQYQKIWGEKNQWA